MNKLHNNPIHTPIWDFVKKLLVASALLAVVACAGVPQNVDALLKKAKAGDAEVQDVVGWAYEYGEMGFPQDDGKATKWYRKAAKQYREDAEHGAEWAQKRLAEMYEDGKGVSKDLDQATEWYRKAAEQGWSAGQSALDRIERRKEEQAKRAAEAAKNAPRGSSTGKALLSWLKGAALIAEAYKEGKVQPYERYEEVFDNAEDQAEDRADNQAENQTADQADEPDAGQTKERPAERLARLRAELATRNAAEAKVRQAESAMTNNYTYVIETATTETNGGHFIERGESLLLTPSGSITTTDAGISLPGDNAVSINQSSSVISKGKTSPAIGAGSDSIYNIHGRVSSAYRGIVNLATNNTYIITGVVSGNDTAILTLGHSNTYEISGSIRSEGGTAIQNYSGYDQTYIIKSGAEIEGNILLSKGATLILDVDVIYNNTRISCDDGATLIGPYNVDINRINVTFGAVSLCKDATGKAYPF